MKNICVVIVLLLACSTAFAAEWIPLVPGAAKGAAPEINLTYSDANQTQVEIVLPGFYAHQTPEGIELSVPGWHLTQEVGFPALPAASFLNGLPEKCDVKIQAVSSKQVTFTGYDIVLAKEPTFDSVPAPQPKPQSWTGDFPSAQSRQGTAGHISKLRVTAVSAFPFQVNGETGDLKVSPQLTVTINHDSGSPTWAPITLTPSVAKRCSQSVINFNSGSRITSRAGGVSYLILTVPALAAAVKPLALWRSMTGFNTKVEAMINPTPTQIKNRIKKYPDLEYVLLVGDSGDMPLYSWSGTYGDHWYACLTGGSNPDLYADIGIGRLCSSQASHITSQVNKIMEYEKNPPLGNWMKRTVFVTHRESYPGKYTQCKNEIATAMATHSDWTVIKLHGGESHTNAEVTQEINKGVNIVNYRGHGNTTSWTGWNNAGEYYDNNDVLALNNGSKRPVVFNICCNNAEIQQYSMCEAWMDAAGGAVAALGAVHPSYTTPNHTYDKALFEAIFEKDITDLGSVKDFASDAILSAHGSMGEKNVKMYLWCGDPAMKVWLDIPSTLSASYTKSIGPGSQSFEVTVSKGAFPLNNATVFCYKDGEVYEAEQTGGNGKATFYLSPTSAGDMYVTVVHPDYLPNEGTVKVSQGVFHTDEQKIVSRDGGVVNFILAAGGANANRPYTILGTMSGTSPGFALPGGLAIMPINYDLLTHINITLMNTAMFSKFSGNLNILGNGGAQFVVGPVPSFLIGTVMDFAYALDGPWDYVSHPVAVKIIE